MKSTSEVIPGVCLHSTIDIVLVVGNYNTIIGGLYMLHRSLSFNLAAVSNKNIIIIAKTMQHYFLIFFKEHKDA